MKVSIDPALVNGEIVEIVNQLRDILADRPDSLVNEGPDTTTYEHTLVARYVEPVAPRVTKSNVVIIAANQTAGEKYAENLMMRNPELKVKAVVTQEDLPVFVAKHTEYIVHYVQY